VAVTVALGAANYVLDGHFFFYAPAVLEFLQPASSRAPWSQGLWVDRAAAPWLWFAMVAAATSLVVLASRLRRWTGQGNAAPVLFSAQFLCALACLAYCQVRGNPVLGVSYRASDLMPFTFLAIGAWLWPGIDAVRPRVYIMICCGAAAAFGIAWLDGPANLIAAIPYAFWIAAAVLAASLAWPWRSAPVTAGFLVFTALLVSSNYASLDAHSYRGQYESLVASRARIESIRQGHAVRFWYDEKDRAMPDAVALGSTYLWGSSLLGRSFAAPPCDVEAPPSTVIAVISADRAHGTDFATSALAACWSAKGMRATPVETLTVDRELYTFTMPILRVEVVPGMWLPAALREASGSPLPSEFPLRNWTVERGEDSSAALSAAPDGVLVRTHARPASLAALSPVMKAPVAGRYRFAIHYWPGAGRFGFGAYAHGQAEPRLAFATDGNWAGSDFEIVFWVDLAEGREFQLGVANNNAQALPASFLMKAVSAIRLAR
jgi:hypothetical protein